MTESKRLQAGHKKFDFVYVLSLNPEFIIGHAGFTDKEMPARYVKFNAPEAEYQCYDIVFRLREEYRRNNVPGSNQGNDTCSRLRHPQSRLPIRFPNR
jgi:hypothetical protein